ncbi:MAG TPA: site-specific DNA-methyltransferase [Micromonosporaceae bacterium]|nr:site-specific DNA-methyltransferase [Micromonosporaceae bacterium]
MTAHRVAASAADGFLYRRIGPVSLYLGDAARVLAALPDGCVDCVVTSPPYWGLRDYGTGRWSGGDPACPHPRRGRARMPGTACPGCGAVWTDLQYGLEPHLDLYIARLVAVFEQVHRVLAPTGTVWLNLGDSYSSAAGGAPASGKPAPGGTRTPARPRAQDVVAAKNLLGLPWRVAFTLQATGRWWLRNAVVWAKTNPMPESVTDRLSATYELVFLLTRSPSYFFDLDPIRLPLKHPDAADGTRVFGGVHKGRTGGVDATARRRGGAAYGPPAAGKYRPDRTDARMRAHRGNLAVTGAAHTAAHRRGRNPGDVWTLPTRPYRGAHTAPFPVDIPLRAIAAGCPPGGHVLDPFSGAGTTGLAAVQLGRPYSGVDISPRFHDLALTRLAPHLSDTGTDREGGGG